MYLKEKHSKDKKIQHNTPKDNKYEIFEEIHIAFLSEHKNVNNQMIHHASSHPR